MEAIPQWLQIVLLFVVWSFCRGRVYPAPTFPVGAGFTPPPESGQSLPPLRGFATQH
jgi:hypothetical protein